ncbi:MAG: hypothetical protein CVV23_16230 [Ignavibacteriae bacterium HGW-Ignavibacteriae-2]|nr:hypothetical protein [Bacteroidota bacterium]PKL87281.1 MAG: hypothetical protein CVV23_16230 [Ignavibacteriae bacterium HGW-Ignavibacteriae-2]
MIELKITNSAALLLLTERMKMEFEKRKSFVKSMNWHELEMMSYPEILEIAECSAIDLISMLPADILLEKNNLDEILYRAIKSLSGVFNKEEFSIYSLEQARVLVRKIESIFEIYTKDSDFNYN